MSESAVLRGLSALAVAVCAAAWIAPEGPLRQDPGQIVEVETAYQTLRVVEVVEPVPVFGESPLEWKTAEVRERFLRFDEDRTSYQSVYPLGPEGGPLTAGRYYDHLALGLWFDGMPWTRAGSAARPRVLIVGYAGGTLERVIATTTPGASDAVREGPLPRAADVIGVEIDPDVVRLSRDRLDPDRPAPMAARVISGADGRAVVDALPSDARFDLIVIDAYQRTQYIPFQVATVEFFRACVRHLEPTGAIGFNVNAPKGLAGRLMRSIASTLDVALSQEGGGAVFVVPNPVYIGNVAVWGTRARGAPRVNSAVPSALSSPAFAVDRLMVRHVRATDGGEVMTDDHAPTERLIDDAFLPADDR